MYSFFALSTTCLILGVEAGMEFMESVEHVEAIFVDQDGVITQTSGMTTFEKMH